MDLISTIMDVDGKVTVCCLICGAWHTVQMSEEDEEYISIILRHEIDCALQAAHDCEKIKH